MNETRKEECKECGKIIVEGYLTRHIRFCGKEKKTYYNKEKAKEYYDKHRQAILDKYNENKEDKKLYYQDNKDKIKERQANYAKKNSDRIKEKLICDHCGGSVNKYYLKKHHTKCVKNPENINCVI